MSEYLIKHAEAEIKSTYGDTVYVKPKSLLKFGQNTTVGTTEEVVLELGGETYVSSNLIDTVSSSSASDSVEVKIEGHYLSGTDLVFSVQTATLNGQNKVTLSQPLVRATRIYNNSGTNLVGDLYVYQDSAITGGVPDDLAKAHLQALAENNQSTKAATSFSYQDYGIITSMYYSVNKKTSATVDFKLKIREQNKVFRTRFVATGGGASGLHQVQFSPYLIAPKNSDIEVTAIANQTNVSVTAGFYSFLAKVGT